MSVKGIVFEVDSGKIVMSVQAPNYETVYLQVKNRDHLDVIYDVEAKSAEKYIVDGAVVDRPSMQLTTTHLEASIGQEISIYGIPTGSTVFHPGGITKVDDGYVKWSSDVVGEFEFTIECFPFKDEVINAVIR